MTSNPSGNETAERKLAHLRASLENDVSFPHLTTGLERYRFTHQALPDLDFAALNLSTTFLGKGLRAPLLISPMTGGAREAGDISPREINLRLAEAAQEFGLALGVGSQRAALERPELAHTYRVREQAPDVLLLANLGAVQLNYGYGPAQCQRAVEMIEANGLVLHLNPLQEYFQRNGNLNFSGLLGRIEAVCRALEVPVIVKEVGWGISAKVAKQLTQVGVAAIDVAGAGGTSWSEMGRLHSREHMKRAIAETFADWGIPTAEAVAAVRRALPDIALIASGGMRTGLDVAKAIALGADTVGFAMPLLKPVMISTEAVMERLRQVIEELRIAMFCVGARDIAALKNASFQPDP